MKRTLALLLGLTGFVCLSPTVPARGEPRRPAGGAQAARPAPSRVAAAPARRSPVTGSRMERPAPRPVARPAPQPSVRPAPRPAIERPLVRPEARPAARPGVAAPGRPEVARPGLARPVTRPATLPGMVSYPSRFDQAPSDRVRPNARGSVTLARPATLPAGKRDWNAAQWGGNRGIWNSRGGVDLRVNRVFIQNNNFSYRPNYWGARPWWGAGSCHVWHHGHWGYGWNGHYRDRHWYFRDDDDFASGFMWGIAVWSLGNMIYDMGYQSYRNPYPAPAVQNTTIHYTQPISVSAAAHPPGDEKTTALAETRSAEATERSRAAFKQGDYLAALQAADEAIAAMPGDSTLHEYRALILFALGRFADAAGVIHPVLASGPGWSWETMSGFYPGTSVYDAQFRKLEAHVKGRPAAAEGHFLVGYHHLVCGHMEQAFASFQRTVELQPADSIARQLRDLTRSSLPDAGAADEATPPAPPVPPDAGKLVGTWICDRGKDGGITFTLAADGGFVWSYAGGPTPTTMKGTHGMNEKGLLVLSTDDSQMVCEVALHDDTHLSFVLVGAPEGDPGLQFTRR